MFKPSRPILTEDMIKKINDAVETVAETGFGYVSIQIEKGQPRWVIPSPSLPLTADPPPKSHGK